MTYYKNLFGKKVRAERDNDKIKKKAWWQNRDITVIGAVIIIVNAKLRHYVTAAAEFLYDNTSIVEKIVGLVCDFLIGKLSIHIRQWILSVSI